MLSKLVSNISKINANNLAHEVFKQKGVQAFIIDLNRENQLFAKGVGVDGEIVGKYTFSSELLSRGISGKGFPKEAGDPYNFYNTGDAFKTFRVKVDKNGFTIDANFDDLIEDNRNIESDKQILGLTNESQIKLVQEIIPLIIEEFRREAFK